MRKKTCSHSTEEEALIHLLNNISINDTAREGLPFSLIPMNAALTRLFSPLKWLFMLFSPPPPTSTTNTHPPQQEQPGYSRLSLSLSPLFFYEWAIVPEDRIPHTQSEARANKNRGPDRQCCASPAPAPCIAIMPRTCTVRFHSPCCKTSASELKPGERREEVVVVGGGGGGGRGELCR